MRGNQKGASPARKGIGGVMSDFAGLRLGGRLDASLPLSMTSEVGSLAPCVTLSEAKGLRSWLARALREAGRGGCAGGVAPLRPYDMAGRDFRCFATAQHDSPLSFPRMRGNWGWHE